MKKIMKKKRALYITLSIIGVILTIISVVGIYYISVMKNTLQKVTTTEEPKAVFSVYVLSEDPAQRIEDTTGYRYGVYSSQEDQEHVSKAQSDLQQTLGKAPETSAYESVFSLIDALQQQEVRAVLLNEAYLASLMETTGYEWTESGLRKIVSYEYQDASQGEPITVPENIPDTFVMYISGIDTYGGISARSRSDVNILAVVNTQTKQILTLATPRDFYVDFSVTNGAKDKLTHAGIYGVDASIDALERLYDVSIDYYLRMNFSGFVEVIDALGGVDVYSDYDFTVKNIKEYHKGYNHLTGLEALAFARERYSFATGDYQRAKNQMEVIRAVITKCASPAILTNFGDVMNAISGSFETNMPEDQIMSLIKMQLLEQSTWEISSFTTQGTSAFAPTYSMPGRDLYVIIPDEPSVSEAKARIQEIQTTA